MAERSGKLAVKIVMMNKKILLSIAFLLFAHFGFAQAQWLSVKVPQLRCWECKERLDNYLKREKGPTGDGGIIRYTFQLSNGTMRIQYNPKFITPDYIKTAIANAGFDADEITAEEDSYKRLPPVCKRAEDGGGPVKGKPCHLPPLP